MDNKIQKTENLYRAIKRSKPDWLDKEGKITSAMYKDEKGNSVDRDAQRELSEIVEFMNTGTFKNRLKGVVMINAGICMEPPIGAIVEAAPTDNNPYHANIFIDSNPKIGSLQALMLADNSEIVYENKSMNWVYK
jgi:ABC-type antimicrobial peptide transport system permease subunit